MADVVPEPPGAGGPRLRNAPVQARSTARLTALLDAAARVVDEVGCERLTTAMVAERAGASIGTVYRYFPDRIAVLQALAERNLERTVPRAVAAIEDARHDGWRPALAAAYAVIVDAFRTEPGFAALRFGDVLDVRPPAGPPAIARVAGRMFEAITRRFGLGADPGARTAFEVALVLLDAAAARAFARDPKGDEEVLRIGTEAAFGVLAGPWAPAR